MTLETLQRRSDALRAEIGKTVLGQEEAVDMLLIALFASVHVLLEGPPGTAKTLLARSFAAAMDLQFGRIQFTPDLMPGDVLGTSIFNFQTNEFVLTPGPVFTQVLLADEINRAPPKTQAALLQAMNERTVSIDGTDHALGREFIVVATQNPIEQQGTYPLPEAQLDRFMFMVNVPYPTLDEEREILRRTTGQEESQLDKVVRAEEILALQKAVRSIPVADHVFDYSLALTRGTRVHSDEPLEFLREWITWGAGPRASQFLILGAKAHAAIAGRNHVAIEDVKAVAHPVLRHRIVTNFSAAAEGMTPDKIIDRILKEVDPSAGVGAGVPGIQAAN